MMDRVPDGLVVEVDDAGVHVELGPPRPRMITVATVVSVVGVSGLMVVAGYFGLPVIQVSLTVVSVVGIAILRFIEFGRNEAALTLRVDERSLTLTRHYRGRVFRTDRYLLSRIAGCSQMQDGIKLYLPGGAIWMKTRFRTPEQNEWVAEMVTDALQKQRTHRRSRQDRSAIDVRVRRSEVCT